MIKIKLKGGLGNQLFQYALGRHLSIIHDTRLAFDLSSLNSDPLRDYRLNVFNISGSPEKPFSNILKNIISPALENYNEKFFQFDPDVLKIPNNSYLEGYWQTEKYFEAIKGIIKSDLSLACPISDRLRPLQDAMHATNSVSIHIRRGDYATNPTTTAFHGLCPVDWYLSAIGKIQERVDNINYFVFSDDYSWVTENIFPPGPTTYIQPSKSGKEAEDLYLMSQCKHNIIANSSFSWWGAWLNQNENKVVIAPQKWFVGAQLDTIDLIPSSWLRM